MKRFLIVILLFFIAIAIAPLLIDEKGYILIKMGDHARETTVTAAIAMLTFIFLLLLVFTKIVKGGFSFSIRAWNKVVFASKRRALKDFNKGIAAYILEDYQQAEHLLAKSAEPAQFEQIAYLLAASAAQKQRLPENINHYLSQLDVDSNTLKEAGLEAVLVKIKLLLIQQQYKKAREVIDLHHKHIGHDPRLLALEIDLSLIEERFSYVIEQLNTARKSKKITDETVVAWESIAFSAEFNKQIVQNSHESLSVFWQKLPRKIKLREAIIIAYCQVLAKHDITQPLVKILLPIVKKGANQSLTKAMRVLPINNPDELIAAVQKQLHHDQNNAMWLSCLAHLALAGQQLAMAEKAFNGLVNLPGQQFDNTDLIAFAKVLELQGEMTKAIEVLKKIALA